jgi:PHD/YefM family antitoxin component YafN of YafNO toxin-antitoxin module
MSTSSLLDEPSRVDEPQAAKEYSQMLTQVASEGKPMIVRRNGEDLAAVIPLDYLELVREVLARQEVQKLAAQIDWKRARQTLRPPQEWLEGDEPKPF